MPLSSIRFLSQTSPLINLNGDSEVQARKGLATWMNTNLLHDGLHVNLNQSVLVEKPKLNGIKTVDSEIREENIQVK